jgi:hypothetical protein
MELLRRATLGTVSTIGLPSLLALLLGVPAMSAFPPVFDPTLTAVVARTNSHVIGKEVPA